MLGPAHRMCRVVGQDLADNGVMRLPHLIYPPPAGRLQRREGWGVITGCGRFDFTRYSPGDRPGCRAVAGWTARRLSDRDRLWARGRCDQRTGRRRDFCGEGPAALQPADRARPGLAEAEPLAVFDDRARQAAARFWPGPLTLVLRRRDDSGLSFLASAGLGTVAIRVPSTKLRRPYCARPAGRSPLRRPTVRAG